MQGVEAQSEIRAVRAWKLLLLLPRMLLFRPTRGGLVSRKQLEARVRRFQAGHWISLLDESFVCAEKGLTMSVRARRRHHPEEAKRAALALSLVQAGELSAARQALEGAALAPGNLSHIAHIDGSRTSTPVAETATER